jgi:hypothetical protein
MYLTVSEVVVPTLRASCDGGIAAAASGRTTTSRSVSNSRLTSTLLLSKAGKAIVSYFFLYEASRSFLVSFSKQTNPQQNILSRSHRNQHEFLVIHADHPTDPDPENDPDTAEYN